jgi:Arc/MetJ-type ribon-helix-helix transcriptional regulator
MELRLTDGQKTLLQRAVESGRYSSEESAVADALLLWETRERRRTEILAAVDQAEASIAQSGTRVITTQADAEALASDIKARGRARLASKP